MRPHVAEVSKLLDAVGDPWAVASWWLSPHGRLSGGACPADLAISADPAQNARVLVLARRLMPNQPPPPGGLAAPAHVRDLEAGTVVGRIHSARCEAHAMNPAPQPSVDEGCRFDSLDGAYPCLYIGDSPEAAIAETLCRDLPLGGRSRMVPASAPLGRQLTSMTVLADIAGLAYRCWHGEDRKVWMLTTDTATATHPLLAVLPDSIVELDGVPGRDLVATALDTHSAVLSTGH